MNISTLLFQIDNNYQPVYTPVLLSLKPFRDLYEVDHSEDKGEYAKQLVYIWHTCDLKSPLFNSEFRADEAALSAFGTKNYKPSDLVKKAQEEYKARQSSSETRALEMSMKMLNDLIKSIDEQNQDITEEVRYMDDLTIQMKEEEDLTQRFKLISMKNLQEEASNKRKKSALEMMPKINDYILKLAELRKTVAKIAMEIDADSNKEKVSNFLIHEILSEHGR